MCPFFQYILRQYIWFYKPEVKQVNVILELTILMPLVTWGQHICAIQQQEKYCSQHALNFQGHVLEKIIKGPNVVKISCHEIQIF